MRRWKSHKIVEAERITQCFETSGQPVLGTADGEQHEVTVDWLSARCGSHDPIGGYLVRYADGYLSWSPATAFEEGYTEVEG